MCALAYRRPIWYSSVSKPPRGVYIESVKSFENKQKLLWSGPRVARPSWSCLRSLSSVCGSSSSLSPSRRTFWQPRSDQRCWSIPPSTCRRCRRRQCRRHRDRRRHHREEEEQALSQPPWPRKRSYYSVEGHCSSTGPLAQRGTRSATGHCSQAPARLMQQEAPLERAHALAMVAAPATRRRARAHARQGTMAVRARASTYASAMASRTVCGTRVTARASATNGRASAGAQAGWRVAR